MFFPTIKQIDSEIVAVFSALSLAVMEHKLELLSAHC